jgi:glutamyl-tRNA synthetase
MQIFNALGWDIPQYGHIPLIHGPDGAKLSKRHGALGVDSYRAMGYLPEAICNCLLRLGWSHGNDEIISIEQAIKWFTIENLGKSASRWDFSKLNNLNGHYMRSADNQRLLNDLLEIIDEDMPAEKQCRLLRGMTGLKQRAKTLLELRDLARIYTDDFVPASMNFEDLDVLRTISAKLELLTEWTEENLERQLREFSLEASIPFGKIASLLRNILSDRKVTPGIFDMLVSFGREESLERINAALL